MGLDFKDQEIARCARDLIILRRKSGQFALRGVLKWFRTCTLGKLCWVQNVVRWVRHGRRK